MYSFKGPDDTGMLTDKNTQLLNTYLSIYVFEKRGELQNARLCLLNCGLLYGLHQCRK